MSRRTPSPQGGETQRVSSGQPAAPTSKCAGPSARGSAGPSWVRLGRELQRAERERSWAGSAPNFTQWIKQRAEASGLTEVSMWRALSAVRRYQELSQARAERGLVWPDLDTLRCGIAAESVHLLEKISRVAEPSVVDDLAHRLIRGDAHRELLQRVWQKYAPLLGGATDRGRGAAKVRPRPSRTALAASSLQAKVIDALMAEGAAWIGHETPTGYAVFNDVTPEDTVPVDIELHAVVAVRRLRSERAEVHGFEVTTHSVANDALRAKLLAMEDFVDFVWLATADRSTPPLLAALPVHVGIVSAESNGLNVARAALPRKAVRAEALLRALILPARRS